jgi:hypothetical protein
MADNILKRWTSKWVQAVAGSGAHLSEIVGMLAQTEAAHADRTELGSPAAINKITWQKAGRVNEPGRYMFEFGCLIVTADDLAIWRQFPNTTFTLVRTANETEEEYRLGTFELPTSPPTGLADVAELLGKPDQSNLGADDLLFGRHGVLQSPRRGASPPRPLRAPPRLAIRRWDQDTSVRLSFS